MLDKINYDKGASALIDPVCGMQIAADSEHRHVHDGTEFLFCSDSCRGKFTASPEKYLHPEEPASTAEDDTAIYTCPMHPEIEQQGPGTCPKCGMALEPKGVPLIATKVEYTCPMHPEIVQDEPGNCPKCGMALEPRSVEAEEDDAELRDMSRRFWFSAILAIPVLISAMAAEFWPARMAEIIDPSLRQWIEMVLATPVILWGGWIFYVRAVQSVINRSLNMFTLIGLGVGMDLQYGCCAVSGHFPAGRV